jgi:putative tricarboxylic transport membrane protein
LFPLILLFCLVGAFTLDNSMTEVGIMILFGVIGYFFKKWRYESAPSVFSNTHCFLGAKTSGRESRRA